MRKDAQVRAAGLGLLQREPQKLRPFLLREKGAGDPRLVLGAPDAVRAVRVGVDGHVAAVVERLVAERGDRAAAGNARSQMNPPAGLAANGFELHLLHPLILANASTSAAGVVLLAALFGLRVADAGGAGLAHALLLEGLVGLRLLYLRSIFLSWHV